MSDDQIKARCAAVGIKWIEPDDDPDGFPGSFDMVTMPEMRALLCSNGRALWGGCKLGDCCQCTSAHQQGACEHRDDEAISRINANVERALDPALSAPQEEGKTK